jgi:hypothetical protein
MRAELVEARDRRPFDRLGAHPSSIERPAARFAIR